MAPITVELNPIAATRIRLKIMINFRKMSEI